MFGINHHSPIKLYCDNQSTLYIVANHVFHDHITLSVMNFCEELLLPVMCLLMLN